VGSAGRPFEAKASLNRKFLSMPAAAMVIGRSARAFPSTRARHLPQRNWGFGMRWADGSPFNQRVQLEEPFGFMAHAIERPSRGPYSNLDLSVASNAIDLPRRKPGHLPFTSAEGPNVVVITAQ
jgi:hypothetical protein